MLQFLSLSHYAHLSWSFIYLSGLHDGTNIKKAQTAIRPLKEHDFGPDLWKYTEIHHVLSCRQWKIKTLKIKDKPAVHICIYVYNHYYQHIFNDLCLSLPFLCFSLLWLRIQPLKCFKFSTKASCSCASLHKLRIRPMLISERVDLYLVVPRLHLKASDYILMDGFCTSGNTTTTPLRNQEVLFTLLQH